MRPSAGTQRRATLAAGQQSAISAFAASIELDEAASVVAREYGVAADLQRLIGEKDQNYKVRADDGRLFVLKLIHPAEDPATTNFQTSVLLKVAEADPALPVQRIVPTLDGLFEKPVLLRDGSRRMMRMTTFLPGVILRNLPPSPVRNRNLGRMLAALQKALEGFSHEADSHEIAWDIKHTLWQRSAVTEMDTELHRGLMLAGLERFEAIQSRLIGLRAQVVHNDMSGDNVVAEPDDHDAIAGVLDFGDAVRTAVINDVAVGVAYTLFDAEDVLASGLPFVSGFNASKPLLSQELDLLLDLIIARMVVRVGITEWRARRFPENSDYILRSTPMTWRVLERLLQLPPEQARSAFQSVCEVE